MGARGAVEIQQAFAALFAFEFEVIQDLKNTKIYQKHNRKKRREASFEKLNATDKVVLLDEKGKEFRSVEFAKHLQQQMNSGVKRLVFIIGGPYGFSPELYIKLRVN